METVMIIPGGMMVSWTKVVAAPEVRIDQIQVGTPGYADGADVEYTIIKRAIKMEQRFSALIKWEPRGLG